VAGPLVLGVRPNLKVDDVALFLGNTLSLNKMVAEPIVVLGTGIKCDRDSPVNGNYGISSLAS
jgi:hypothetical protein